MQMTKWTGLLLLCLYCCAANGQVVGGQYAFEYLRLSNAPHVSALGGISVANPDDDIAFALQNPSLMRPALHNELELNYNGYYAGISVMNLQYGYHVPKINTSFALGVQYLNYGTFTHTDDLGNIYGNFSANDYALTLAASRSYEGNWRYGADIKWAHSTLYTSTASAVLSDVGINYYDTSTLWDFGVVAKNMGVMLKEYTPNNYEPLPFDLQMGVTKQFKHLPLRLIATVHHLYQWDIKYNNPADNITSNILGTADTNANATKGYFFDKLFRHFIFGAELTLAKRLALTVAYNDLERTELAIQTHTGLAGFSFGVNLYLNKFQVHYARNYYHIAGPYNEIGITMALNKLFGAGRSEDHLHWSAVYPDWQ